MSFKCTRKIEFDAAHRVIGHEGKCKYLHGHRYVLEITAEGARLDNTGRVIDFGVLKSVMKDWIDEHFDHNAILSEKDRELGSYITKITEQNIFYLPSNPTAENIASYLFHEICPKLFLNYNIKISNIKLYETPNCFVEI